MTLRLLKIAKCPLCKMTIEYNLEDVELTPSQNRYRIFCPLDASEIRILPNVYLHFKADEQRRPGGDKRTKEERQKLKEEAQKLYKKHGTLKKVAEVLEVSVSTVSNRLKYDGGKVPPKITVEATDV